MKRLESLREKYNSSKLHSGSSRGCLLPWTLLHRRPLGVFPLVMSLWIQPRGVTKARAQESSKWEQCWVHHEDRVLSYPCGACRVTRPCWGSGLKAYKAPSGNKPCLCPTPCPQHLFFPRPHFPCLWYTKPRAICIPGASGTAVLTTLPMTCAL